MIKLLHGIWAFAYSCIFSMTFFDISTHLGFVDVWGVHTCIRLYTYNSVRHNPATGQSFLDEYLQSRPPDLFTRVATPCIRGHVVCFQCDNSTWPGQSAAASRTSTGPRYPTMLAESTGLCMLCFGFEDLWRNAKWSIPINLLDFVCICSSRLTYWLAIM